MGEGKGEGDLEPKVLTEKCTGCGACLDACAFGAIEMPGQTAQINTKCTVCGACQEACPSDAIVLPERKKEAPSPDARGVWVYCEQERGVIKSSAFELLTRGRALADSLKTTLTAVVLGHGVKGLEALATQGADQVLTVDDPALCPLQDEPYARVLADLAREHKPAILLGAATAFGRAFIPRVAARLETGLTADCTGLEIDGATGLLLQTRPTFGGNVMATIVCDSRRPQMATVRPHVFKRGAPDGAHTGQIITVSPSKEAVTSHTKILSFLADITEQVKLEECSAIVAGGRGLGQPSNFKLVEELASALGAAVGSSRPPVDDGWIPYARQVGQTGKTVCPRLYVAVGISGAVQHLAGMQTAENIIAVNSDPRAPIFEVATWGIVGDLFKVVPLLVQEIKKARG
jgi:electron transfer flavoprotein alpha subunit